MMKYQEFYRNFAEAFAGRGPRKPFGKFKPSEAPGNKIFDVILSADVEGREITFHTTITAYNRDEAFAHAKAELKRKNPHAVDIIADHIGTK